MIFFLPPPFFFIFWLQKCIIEKDIHCEQISLKLNTNCLYCIRKNTLVQCLFPKGSKYIYALNCHLETNLVKSWAISFYSISETVSASFIRNCCVEWCGHMLYLYPWYTLSSHQAAMTESNRQFLKSTIAWLIPWEDFVSYSCHESSRSFRSHIETSDWCVHACVHL